MSGGTVPGYAIGYLEDVERGAEIIEYLRRIEATFEPFGGAWMVHGTQHVTHEGRLPGDLIIIGFPSVTAARAWLDSEPYRRIVPLRTGHARSVIVSVEGVPPGYRAEQTIAKLAG
ncbi:DUF1330 domain-containing protein [Enemella evansiae]|uniref:DUF1330 domain-containing protein n=1 Tax=Enemella evansiae TaxID=2016499 RepID=UPI000B975E5F|nr:DUF1330 domain-containing protein [Enemella evansiae]OYN93024.1 hypothetical protein CGZ95_20425 [Enemella evansiae]OYO04143.1 hypothetical protein CGZ97_12300 [Enemella evansiae]